MTPTDHPARRRFVDIVEAELTRAGCEASPVLARTLLAKLDAAHLHLTDLTPPPGSDWREPAPAAEPGADYLAAKAALHDRNQP